MPLTMQGLAPSSRRVYQRTYTVRGEFCQHQDIHPLSLTFENVAKFLNFYEATKTTKQHKLSALRRLVETLTIVDYENPQWEALGADKPMSTTAIYNVIRKSGDFSPHDARRTLLTDMLKNGVSVADAQFVAGHVNPQTTLRSAQVKDAKKVKGRIKVSY